jgi:hypothetical protein
VFKEEENKPKISIINYTTDDFLNEFTKEAQHSKPVAEHDFEFMVRNFLKQECEEEKSKELEPEYLSPLDKIFKHKLKTSLLIEKYFTNLNKITETLNKEFSNINNKLDKIVCFVRKYEISKFKFEKDRKLSIFINASLQFVLFSKKIIGIVNFLKGSNYLNYCNEINANKLQSEVEKIVKVMDSLGNEKFNFLGIMENSLFEKIKNNSKDDVIKTDKVCFMCLHELDNEPHSNVFSYDFHIQCINFWLNCVDNLSPFLV